LDDVIFQVRDSAIWALGQLGGEEAADALLLLLDNTDDEELLVTLEEALDHLAFVNNTRDFLVIDFADNEE